MISADSAHSWLPLTAQVATIACGLVTLAFMPPAHGKMILIPLTDRARATLVPLAVARGAVLVAQGPMPGSFVVDGARARIAAAMYRRGIIVLAAPTAGCKAIGTGQTT